MMRLNPSRSATNIAKPVTRCWPFVFCMVVGRSGSVYLSQWSGDRTRTDRGTQRNFWRARLFSAGKGRFEWTTRVAAPNLKDLADRASSILPFRGIARVRDDLNHHKWNSHLCPAGWVCGWLGGLSDSGNPSRTKPSSTFRRWLIFHRIIKPELKHRAG